MASCCVPKGTAESAGCNLEAAAPEQGDVRLAPIPGLNVSTQPCDEVHFGAVEFFNDGRWGRICRSSFNEIATFSVDARVICRQLGFPFSNLIDVQEVRTSFDTIVGSTVDIYTNVEYLDLDPEQLELVWATEVQCTGQEERLSHCFFPENFGNVVRDYGDNLTPAAMNSSPPGIQDTDCRARDQFILGVVCRRFEIEGDVFHISLFTQLS